MYMARKGRLSIARSAPLVFALVAAAVAQTAIYGNNTTTPINIYGDATTLPTVLNAAPTYTRIFVVFPPQSGSKNTNFTGTVMIQSAIDGVNLEVPWNLVETSSPTTTNCTLLSPPANAPDRCQQDSAATSYYHTYIWTTVDGTGCADTTTGSTSQWFCDFPPKTEKFKQVALQLFGIGGTPANGVTPSYVTNASWSSATGSSAQDIVNNISASSCGSYTGQTTIPTSTFTGNASNSTVTVNWTSHPFVDQEAISVTGFTHAGLDATGTAGAAVHYIDANNFSYPGDGIANFSEPGSNGTLIRGSESWPVPTETPYASAWKAFLKAAIYHFNNYNNVVLNPSGSSINQSLSQIAYIRPGVARGGEAIPLCSLSAPMVASGYSKANWDSWYTAVASTVQSATPQMQIMFSINAGDPQHADPTIATAQAGIAVSYASTTGLYNGFGSQGLALSDDSFTASTCPQTSGTPNTGNNWGCMFSQYWSGATTALYPPGATPSTVPLELQQIDCSNPCTAMGATCSTGGLSDGCFQGGAPGKTKDLKTLFPFITSNYTSIIELYNQDALLAFDPSFCVISGVTSCDLSAGDSFGSSLSAATQNGFFQYVGIGYGSCGTQYSVTQTQTNATGDCSYAAAIYSAHGPH